MTLSSLAVQNGLQEVIHSHSFKIKKKKSLFLLKICPKKEKFWTWVGECPTGLSLSLVRGPTNPKTARERMRQAWSWDLEQDTPGVAKCFPTGMAQEVAVRWVS